MVAWQTTTMNIHSPQQADEYSDLKIQSRDHHGACMESRVSMWHTIPLFVVHVLYSIHDIQLNNQHTGVYPPSHYKTPAEHSPEETLIEADKQLGHVLTDLKQSNPV